MTDTLLAVLVWIGVACLLFDGTRRWVRVSRRIREERNRDRRRVQEQWERIETGITSLIAMQASNREALETLTASVAASVSTIRNNAPSALFRRK
jgi:hypothetical protein